MTLIITFAYYKVFFRNFVTSIMNRQVGKNKLVRFAENKHCQMLFNLQEMKHLKSFHLKRKMAKRLF